MEISTIEVSNFSSTAALRSSIVAAALLFFLTACGTARAEVRLPHVLGNNMVLQRDASIRIWGTAAPGEKVTVTLSDQRATATTQSNRHWELQLPAMPAGGPYRMVVEGTNRIVVDNVLLGEVWFCSGQSNMEWIVVKSIHADQEVPAANFPMMRLFTTPAKRSNVPLDDVEAQWRVCSPQTISYFSAVAYFFGRELHRQLHVPVGLVVSAVGGTRIEPWTPGTGVAAVPQLAGKDRSENGDLYNGMIHPFTPLALRGVIWYQGEGNVGDGMLYRYRMQALIDGWRGNWKLGDVPFYYVQVAPLNWGGKPVDQVPQLWEAQSAALAIPHTGMVVTNDIGNIGDAHPRNKQEVGRRLALWALAKTYGRKDLAFSGPQYKSMRIEKDKIRVSFDYAGGELMSRDKKPLNWFTTAGRDGKFVPAQALIEGETVVVWAPAVAEPVAVRFAWHQIAEPNLMNKHGLPASAFRTDGPQ